VTEIAGDAMINRESPIQLHDIASLIFAARNEFGIEMTGSAFFEQGGNLVQAIDGIVEVDALVPKAARSRLSDPGYSIANRWDVSHIGESLQRTRRVVWPVEI
jgi:hypothetical protein